MKFVVMILPFVSAWLVGVTFAATDPFSPDERDQQVIGATLSNLVLSAELSYSRWITPEERPSIVFLDDAPSHITFSINQIRDTINETFPDGVLEGLIERNSKAGSNLGKPVSYKNLRVNERVIVSGLSGDALRLQQFRHRFPSARAWVHAWLPGYSPNGNNAIFRAQFGPSGHTTIVTVLLRKENERWLISWVKFTYWL